MRPGAVDSTPPGIRPLDLSADLRPPAPAVETVAGLLALAAERDPGRVAVRDPRGALTYRRLQADATALAAGLPGAGPVLVLVRPGRAEVTAILGAALAGRAYVALDATAPTVAWAAVSARFPGAAVVVDAATADAVAAVRHDGPVVRVDGLPPGTAGTTAGRRPPAPEDVALVSWTSGTTGRPKGVVHSNRAVVRNALRVRDGLGLRPDDRLLATAPFCFVGGATPMFAALAAGATLCVHVLAAEGTAGLHAFVAACGPTVVHTGPGRARMFGAQARRHGPMATVRLVVVGGDRLEASHVRALASAFPRARIVHRYSLSETNWVTGCEIVPAELDDAAGIPVGWPVPWLDVRAAAADAEVTGDSLALGYWEDEARTSAVFADTPAGRTFRTGDRLREGGGGLLWFAGRSDRATKVNGVRIDPVEIEQVLESVDGVDRAAVVAVALDGGPARLAAFVVADGTVSSAAAVRRAVAGTLPAAKLPATIELVQQLPTTSRGKVDLDALARRAAAGTHSGSEPARDDREAAVARIVGRVLDREGLGRDADLFALGADSLDTEELAAALEPVLRRRLRPADLLAHPTVAELAALAGASSLERPRLVRARRGTAGRVPLVLLPGGGGGSVEAMAALGRGTGDRDVLIPVPRGYDRRGRPDRSVEAMAATIVADLLPAVGGGPVVLAGHSSGGVVAFEAARRLTALGVAVGALVLIDAGAPGDAARIRRRQARAAEVRLARGGRAYAALRSRVRPRRWWRRRTAGVLARSGAEQQYAFSTLRGHAIDRYRPMPYDGDVVILRAVGTDPLWESDPAAEPVRDLTLWRSFLLREPRFVDVDGGHEGVVLGVHRAATAQVLAGIAAACDPPGA